MTFRLNRVVRQVLIMRGISPDSADYETGQPDGQPDQIIRWNASLGAHPSQVEIDAANAELAKQVLSDHAAAARFLKETGGITVSGLAVMTDRQSQAMISGAFLSAKDDATFATKWKAADGSFVSLDNATILAVGRAVRAHVETCFFTESNLASQISAGTVTTPAEIDSAFAALTTAY